MIYIIKQEGLYQNKVNSSLVSTFNCKMGYCTSAQDHLLAMSLILNFGELRLNLLDFFFLFIQKICVNVFYPALNLQAFPSALGKQASVLLETGINQNNESYHI